MTDLKQAAQMALEALRYPLDTSAKLFDADKAELMNLRAINALRKALEEQPEKYTFGTPLLDLFKVSPGQIVHADALAEPEQDELRRLHAENKALREANEAFGKRQEWWNEKMVALEAINAELVEALHQIRAHTLHSPTGVVHLIARAALAKVEASK